MPRSHRLNANWWIWFSILFFIQFFECSVSFVGACRWHNVTWLTLFNTSQWCKRIKIDFCLFCTVFASFCCVKIEMLPTHSSISNWNYETQHSKTKAFCSRKQFLKPLESFFRCLDHSFFTHTIQNFLACDNSKQTITNSFRSSEQ